MSKNKLTNCKVCGVEIAANAKSCPHCGAKPKKRTALGVILIILGVIVIFAALGGSSNEPEKVGDNSESAIVQSQDNTSGLFTIGDVVKLNDVYVTLVGVEINSGADFFTPEDGNVYAICEFEIDNQSSEELAISSMMCFEAYVDDYATSMSITATTSADKTQLDGSVAAGKKMNGVIGYEIPSDWKELEIRFTPDFWTDKDIVFVVTNG